MLDWKSFFLAYLRSRSRVFTYIFSLGFLVLLFQFLFASLGTYFLYFFLLSSFVTFLFLAWDIFAEAQVYRQEVLYTERAVSYTHLTEAQLDGGMKFYIYEYIRQLDSAGKVTSVETPTRCV